MLNYRVGAPFWKSYARLVGSVSLRINVERDEEAGVFIATSPDLSGLVVEGRTLDELVPELRDCIDMLITEMLHAEPRHPLRAELRLGLSPLAA